MGGKIGWIIVIVINQNFFMCILNDPKFFVQSPSHSEMNAARASAVDDAIDGVIDGHIELGCIPNQEVEGNAGSARALVVGQPDLDRD